jgi:uncharacterized protein YndB with AHSA1/START domain
MTSPKNTLQVTVQRIIPAPPDEVFDGWLDPKVPGNPWNFADEFRLDATPGGLFYWRTKDAHHYGRFIKIDSPVSIRHTWVSASTLGAESVVTVTFEQKGGETLLTLVHSGLPDTEQGKGHEKGWNFFLERFSDQMSLVRAGRPD